MKENVYIAPGAGQNSHSVHSSSPGATNNVSSSQVNNHQIPAAHNNQFHELQNLQKLHAAGLTISGVKGRSSPKLSSNSNNLSITSGGREKDRDLGVNLTHLGIPGLFGSSHIPGLGNLPIPGLIPPAHSGSRSNSQKSSNAKVSTLLKVTCSFSALRNTVPSMLHVLPFSNSKHLQETPVPNQFNLLL